MSSTTELVARMAQALAGAGVDPSDEKACIRALNAQKFKYSDIVLFGDLAAAASRLSILIIPDSESEPPQQPARGYPTAYAGADIVIKNGFVVKDRDDTFARLVR